MPLFEVRIKGSKEVFPVREFVGMDHVDQVNPTAFAQERIRMRDRLVRKIRKIGGNQNLPDCGRNR